MRVMIEFFGIIFIDGTEIVLRVYTIENKHWQLTHYASRDLLDKKREKEITPLTIAEAIADLFSTTYVQKVVEWKICTRGLSKKTATEIAHATGLKIEHIERIREQELLCKGLFTEFW
jgi:hypothetical protein